MKQPYYLFKHGRLRRKDNTLVLEAKAKEGEEKGQVHAIPVADVESLYIFGELDLNSRLLDFLGQQKIPLHEFNFFGYYAGTYYPRHTESNGDLLVRQVRHYTTKGRRLKLAAGFVRGAAGNIRRNLKYHHTRGADLAKRIAAVEALERKIGPSGSVDSLRGVEGNIRNNYYQAFNAFLKMDEPFRKRVYHPPDTPMNALISFGNALLYATVLSEIYRSPLTPTVGYLHEPGRSRMALGLDLSEVFKPIVVDRLIFWLVNHGALKPRDFERKGKGCYLAESGRKRFVEAYDKRLRVTVKHRELGRSVSYRSLIRHECYKLVDHLKDKARYEPFLAWW